MAIEFASKSHYLLMEKAESISELKDVLIANVSISLSADREILLSLFHNMRLDGCLREASVKYLTQLWILTRKFWVIYVVLLKVKESKLDLKLVKEAYSSDSFVQKYATWFDKKNRGDLMKPCDDFYLLLRELETVMRKMLKWIAFQLNHCSYQNLKKAC
ncbi:hypothetical protein KUTeg_021927 [Tegillarca granosa]|uniref:Uncharacterized protein n=1 Tax=Tegillarca granosa TaxID=220873 RepID=A0ABQ9E4R4_TEGGR|nr:hypothetical protein KUTeg_021927 [Tegillarca granosa]